MDKKICVKEILREVKTSPFLLYCEMPMGYVEGLPILQIRNGNLCLLIPFLRYQITGEVDKTLVYPIRFAVTVLLPEGKVMGYQDLKIHPQFAKVDFTKPVLLGYTGLSDAMLIKYIEDSRYLWENGLDEIRYTAIGSVIGTHVGPGAVAVAFFKKKS